MPQVALPAPSPGPEHHYYCKPTTPCPELPTMLTSLASAQERASSACDWETSQAHTLCLCVWAPFPLLSSSSTAHSSSWCHKGWRNVVEGACHATKNPLVVLQVIKKTLGDSGNAFGMLNQMALSWLPGWTKKGWLWRGWVCLNIPWPPWPQTFPWSAGWSPFWVFLMNKGQDSLWDSCNNQNTLSQSSVRKYCTICQ